MTNFSGLFSQKGCEKISLFHIIIIIVSHYMHQELQHTEIKWLVQGNIVNMCLTRNWNPVRDLNTENIEKCVLILEET